MDQKLQTAEKLSTYQILRRTLQFVFTVSIFFSVVWYSSGFSILPQSFSTYFSTFLFSMFSRTLERKYIFVIFNGILVFLVKTSVCTSSSMSAFNIEIPFSVPPETKIPANDQEGVVVLSKSTVGSPESASLMPEEELEREHYREQVSEAEEQGDTFCAESEERENQASIVEEEDYEGETGSEVLVKQDNEADSQLVANEELDNTDELNRKFEEFIRKMKEEIRIEARRQLISV